MLLFFAYIYNVHVQTMSSFVINYHQLPSTNPSPVTTCNSRLDLLRRSKPCLLKEGGGRWCWSLRGYGFPYGSLLVGGWVEPTHLEKICKSQIGIIFLQIFGTNIPNMYIYIYLSCHPPQYLLTKVNSNKPTRILNTPAIMQSQLPTINKQHVAYCYPPWN